MELWKIIIIPYALAFIVKVMLFRVIGDMLGGKHDF